MRDVGSAAQSTSINLAKSGSFGAVPVRFRSGSGPVGKTRSGRVLVWNCSTSTQGCNYNKGSFGSIDPAEIEEPGQSPDGFKFSNYKFSRVSSKLPIRQYNAWYNRCTGSSFNINKTLSPLYT